MFLVHLTSLRILLGNPTIIHILFGAPYCPKNNLLGLPRSTDVLPKVLPNGSRPPSWFENDKIQKKINFSAPNVPYIFLGTPNILQNHIQHLQHPLVPPIAIYIYIYIYSNPMPFLSVHFSIALLLLIPISPFIISVPHHFSSSLVFSKCVFVIDQT